MVALLQCMKLWALVIPFWSTSVLYQWDFARGAVKYFFFEGGWDFGLWACDAGWGWTSFSGFLQSPAHAAGCSNSSDTHAQERRFSAAWSLTGSDYTWGNKQHILKPFQVILKLTQHKIYKTQKNTKNKSCSGLYPISFKNKPQTK